MVKRTAAELRPSRPSTSEGSSISSYESPSTNSSNPELVPRRRPKLAQKKRTPRAASASSTGSDTASESSTSSERFGQPEAANYSEASTDDDEGGNNANARVHPLIAELEQDEVDEIPEHYIEGTQVEDEEWED